MSPTDLRAITEPSPHDERLAAWVGLHLSGRLAVVGGLSPAMLRGLLVRVRSILHIRPDPVVAELLGAEVRRLTASPDDDRSATDLETSPEARVEPPPGAALDSEPPARYLTLHDAGALGRHGVDAVLVFTDNIGAARHTLENDLADLSDHAPVVAIAPTSDVSSSEIPSPDPTRAILFLRRRPPRFRPSARPPADVSVIIPTYNRAKLLPDAVRSAMAQDPPPAEILVADDGSTEDIAAALRPFEGRVRHLRLEHKNMSAAMNAALREARCEMVAWLDDDDLFLPEKLGLQLPSLASSDVGFSATAHYIADHTGRAEAVRYLPEFRDDQLMRLLLRGSIFLGPTVMVRRTAYDGLLDEGPYDESLDRAADYAMWLKLARSSKVRIVQLPLTTVRRHPGNELDASRARAIFQSVQKSMRWLRDHVPLEELWPSTETAWRGRALLERARASIRVGLFEGAAADLEASKAVGMSPVRVDCLLGLMAMESGELERAQSLFERAVATGGDDVEALNGLGATLLLLDKRADAARQFQLARDRAPGDPLPLYNLGIAEAGSPASSGTSAASMHVLARDLLARQTHRSALYSTDPPVTGLDRFFAELRRQRT